MVNIQDLGSKHRCLGCATRFFDLNRHPAICPKCTERIAVTKPRVLRKRWQASDSIDAVEHRVLIKQPQPKRVKWRKEF